MRLPLGTLLSLVAITAWVSAQDAASFTSTPLKVHAGTSIAGSEGAVERHLQPSEAGTLYGNSAFAHGYRHGYEEGFHSADLDIHMGRENGLTSIPKEYHDGARQYRSAFGSKKLFQQGFQTGFRRGYKDAFSGGEYQLHEHIQNIAAGLELDILPPTRRAHFDDGFAAGYSSAQTASAPSRAVGLHYVEQYCRTTVSDAYALDYCSGFSRGYLLGAADGPAKTIQSASSKSAR